MIRRRRCDVVVIGAGTAGLVAGTRLAQAGADVYVVAKGVGSTHLAPGTIDVLGYTTGDTPGYTPGDTTGDTPGDAPERVAAPAEALARLVAQRPDHPYALLGAELVAEALHWFIDTAARGPLAGYGYVGGLERNLLLPTAIGALKPSAAAPQTFAAGDAPRLGRLTVVGTPALRDFHASLCAANLRAGGIDAGALAIELELERADANTLTLARRFDEPRWRAGFSARLAPLLGSAEQVGLPAMLGLQDPHAVLAELEARLGRRVFEIPTLPPSVPGMRLFAILRHALRSAGGRLMLGAGVVAHQRQGDRVAAIETVTAGSNTSYAADAFVLAAGGFHSGAIALDSHWRAQEQLLGLPLQGVPEPDRQRFVPSYLDEQPLSRAGVAVDAQLRAAGVENVVV
ncbi:MAG: anaerobic glycerol-3-phosphate dehydrogenase subunit B, partial [Acidobacteriota bacterium]|nr:anaerobic glycerol-3-phosphate dehydrogenase subunit B [Acidobacteriota bacterium]